MGEVIRVRWKKTRGPKTSQVGREFCLPRREETGFVRIGDITPRIVEKMNKAR